MKFGLIFLSVFVVITQQFYLQRPNIPMLWFSSPPHRIINYYHPLEDHHQDALVFHRQNENPSLTIAGDNLNNTEGFPDTQSRIRGISVNRPSINDYHGGRYLMSGGFNNYVNNPFLRAFTIMSTSTVTAFKTAMSTATSTSFSASTSISIITSIISTISISTSTIMNTAVLSLTLVVKCVPSFQVSPSPFACRRKKEIYNSEDSHQQFLISPSQTLKLIPTALPSEISGLSIAGQLTSSKDETEISNEEQKLRSKRFFFNRFHQFSTLTETETTTSTTNSVLTSVVTSVIVFPTTTTTTSVSTSTAFTTATLTSYLFSNSTITQTVNLINPAPTKQCLAAAVAAGDVVCVACLPSGYTICK